MRSPHAILMAPSILAADFGYLADEIQAVERGGADLIHVDVMDGQFVPNITFGPALVEAARRATTLPLNLHLMMVNPESLIDAFAKAGADQIMVQAESSFTVHLHRTLGRIRDLGKSAGVAINPGSPLALIEEVLHMCDIVNVMTVNPGFGGQAFLPETMPKLRRLRALCDAAGRPEMRIMVDGGISVETAPIAVEAGADVLVAGSSVFGKPDYGQAIAAIRTAATTIEA
ncbi:ribulose-phosphate 3-epimerase [Lichenihabitans sp. Uapishka_5]|uniref:ribulose-phosphate 3-epimerase n=1 Tax=Lichenihabitans sp. Uapishka_5 TaxID=3037302 RepID=UPI0029E801DC|nr:ribulose-phosphate 3-epimerase [Lichenihabitans sp. Uapishka_5]MDX7951880.1 ribulose-phosphate 3-epimerase [Lichenihabitans sp. Uapishka_5]